MAKIGEQLGLALESPPGFPFAGGLRLFDRNQRVHALVDGFINCAHAAVAEFAHDAITVLEENGISYGTKLKIKFDNLFLFELPLTPTFADAGERGAPAAYINSRGYLSLGRNAANLADRCNIAQGMSVSVTH